MQLIVNIDVDDLEKAITFYERALGLRLGRRLLAGSVAEMLGASSTIYLLQKPPGSVPALNTSQLRDFRRHWTPIHLDIVVDDIDAAVRCAKDAGARMEADVQAYDWGTIATLSDPFGHGFCLLKMSASGYAE